MQNQDTNPDPILRMLEGQHAWTLLLGGTLAFGLGLVLLRSWLRLARPLMPTAAEAQAHPPITGPVILVSVLTLLLLQPLFALSPDLDPEEKLRQAVVGTLQILGLVAAMALLLQWSIGAPAAGLGFRLTRPGRALPLAAGTYVTLWPLLFAVTALEMGWHGLRGTAVPMQEAVQVIQSSATLGHNWWFLAAVTVVQPCLEEVLYRGVVLGYLRRSLPPLAAVLVDSVLFAAVHDAGRPQVFALSLGMGFLFLRTGSLLAPCLLHIMHNSLAVALFLLL